MKSLLFSASNKPGVFSVMLSDGYSQKCLGTYNEANRTFTTQRNEKKHLHRNTNSIAINQMVLEISGLKWVCVLYEDLNGRKTELKTSKDYLLAHGKKSAFKSTDWEAQIFLPLNLFSMELAQRYAMQLNAQPSLFTGA